MTAARTLTEADVEAVAERVVAKLRAPRPRKRAPEKRIPSPEAVANQLRREQRAGRVR